MHAHSFGATFGVGAYSNIDMISSLCILMSRGAFISMFCVICILPAFFIIFDKFIIKGSYKFLEKIKKMLKINTIKITLKSPFNFKKGAFVIE